MKTLVSVVVALVFASVSVAQTPYVKRWGPGPVAKGYRQCGVFQGDKRVKFIVDGKTYWQPNDWIFPGHAKIDGGGVLRITDERWRTNTFGYWTDGQPYVDGWQILGHTGASYHVYFSQKDFDAP